MAVELLKVRESFVGTGAPANYTPGIYAKTADQVKVYENGVLQTLNVDYTLNDLGNTLAGFSVNGTFVSGATVLIQRETVLKQQVDTVNNATILEEVFDDAIDKSMMIDQEIATAAQDGGPRVLRVPSPETVDPFLPAAGRKNKVLWGDSLTGALALIDMQLFANALAPLLNFSFTGVPGPGNDLATHYETPDISGNDTAAIAAALLIAQANTGILKIGKGNFFVDQMLIPTGVIVIGAGKGLTFVRQRPGTAPTISATKIGGPRSGILGCTVVGNIATDTGEFHNAVECVATLTTGNIYDVLIDVAVQDIRGDGVIVGIDPTAYAAGIRLWKVRFGVEGDNIYRNGWSIVGGDRITVDYWRFTRVGLYDWDIEPDTGYGPATNTRIAAGKGSFVNVGGTTATDNAENTTIEGLELVAGFVARSVPAYPLTLTAGFQFRNAPSINFTGDVKISGYQGAAIAIVGGSAVPRQVITGKRIEIVDCCKDGVLRGYISLGAAGYFDFDVTYVQTTHVNNRLFVSESNFKTRHLIASALTASLIIQDCDDFRIDRYDMTINGAGAGGTAIHSSRNFVVDGGAIVGDVLCGFGCTDGRLNDIEATVATTVNTVTRLLFTNANLNGTRHALLYYLSATSTPSVLIDAAAAKLTAPVVNAATRIEVNAQQVVGARGAALPADATDLPTVIALANATKARLKVTGGHGLVSD